MKWAKINNNNVYCPTCGKLKDLIINYGIYDDETYYFCIKCSCGTKYAYLATTDFKDRFIGEYEFSLLGVVYSGSIGNTLSPKAV